MRSTKPTKEFRFFLYDHEGDGMLYFDSKEQRDICAALALEFYKDSMIKLYRILYNLNGTMTKDGNLLIDNMFANFLIEKKIN